MIALIAVVAIFMYHHVSPVIAPGPYQRALTISPDEFRSQLAWLHDHGCAVRTVTDLVRAIRAGSGGRCNVALSFDDGYEDAATYAAPLLERDGLTGTFYITTGFIGNSSHMSVRQVAALSNQGMEIGAHTVSHSDLTTLSGSKARDEIDNSKMQLERWTGTRVASFAYPAGSYNARIEQDVKSAGFECAVSTQPGALTSATLSDPYSLPRYRIVRGEGIALFRSVLGLLPERRAGVFNRRALQNVARQRIEGNDPKTAERVAVALLESAFPEQILKVKILKEPPASVAGIMLSGVKFHEPVDSARFASDTAAMIDRTFSVDPQLSEVDVWAVVPIKVAMGVTVSGDLAEPTSRTVFSIAATRAAWQTRPGRAAALRESFWDEAWRKTLTRK